MLIPPFLPSALPWQHAARVARWVAEIVPGPERAVAWTHPSEVLLETPRLRLRAFGPLVGAPAPDATGLDLPLLVVAPEVNGSHLADFGPGQSLVTALAAQGWTRVHLLEWRSACAATADDDVEGSIDAIEACIDALGGRVFLLGICQGGWESAIVAARRPEAVAGLALAAAPIDFRGGTLSALVDATPPSAYAGWVALGGGVMRGDLIRHGFTQLRFLERRVLDPLVVWNRLDDEDYLDRRHRLAAWYESRKDLPGRAYLRIVQELFRENRLIEGRFTVHGAPVDLGAYRGPVALVAGARDHITLPHQLFAAERAFPGRCARWTADAGHIGVVVTRDALDRVWPEVTRFLVAPENDATA